jgi:hypothetical protein
MNRITLLGLSALFSLPLMCAPETWTTVPMVDVACSAKVRADPDAHTRVDVLPRAGTDCDARRRLP